VPFLILTLFFLKTVIILDWKWIAICVFITILSYGGFIAFMYSLQYGKPGLVVPIASGRIVLMSVIGFVFLSESFSYLKFVMVSIIFLGVVLASVDFKEIKNSDVFKWQSGVPLAILAALGWGLTMPFFKLPSMELGALFAAFVIELTILLAAVTHGLFLERRNYIKNWKIEIDRSLSKRMIAVSALVGISTGVASLFLNLAFMTGYISIASAVGGAGGLVTVILGAVLFKEKLTVQQYFASALIFIGILLPAFFAFT